MGYTHYFYRPRVLPKDLWAKFSQDCAKIVQAVADRGVDLAGPMGQGEPKITKDLVAFNGRGDYGHEGFVIERVFTPRPGQEPNLRGDFAFCKTAFRPYDLAVTAVLVAAKHHFRPGFQVHSDGDMEDWVEGISLCEQELGYGADFQLDK